MSFNGLPPLKPRKMPKVDDLNWRMFTCDEVMRLFYCGTASGKSHAVKDIINQRKATLNESEFKQWYKALKRPVC